ncbi:unnamed protein product [Penicillium roqueforti FM164]|uniref:Genomic scaffold, ProqFM164S02 n=1 Tax=Penicillium roqueforti (strain FM164) TaxID=1365484 RepID=W6Q5S8_PENRF|nr:unnamed protein product [Penicillium roqueforti FM164]
MLSRKDFFAKRNKIAETKRRLQRERNSYIPRAHRQEDSIQEKDKRLPQTNTSHYGTVNLWLKFTADPENGFEYYRTSLVYIRGRPRASENLVIIMKQLAYE